MNEIHCEACGEQTDGDAVMIDDTVLCEDCASSAVNCQACGEQVFTYPFVADATGGEEAVLLAGDIVLCEDCYLEALAARRKIVVSEDEGGIYEDRSALTAEEREWAELLDIAEEAANQADRELIRDYPRDEQRQLHRYQDDIEAERFRSGKST